MDHHRHSNRLKNFDYTNPGMYFVTVCTKNRECVFGDIGDGRMVLNEWGRVVRECWLAIPKHFGYVGLDEFVVMPNHMHGIIVIHAIICRGTACRAPTEDNVLSTEQFGKPVSGSISTIMRSFKSAVTKRINILRDASGVPIWQRNYYDRIIRNEIDLNRIREYVIGNPSLWQRGLNHLINL